MTSNSDDFSDFGDVPNENAKDRMHGWLLDGIENVPDDEVKAHLDEIFAAAVPESLLTGAERRKKAQEGGEIADALTAQFRETVNQQSQLKASITQNDALHKQLEETQTKLNSATQELANANRTCSELKLQIAVFKEQLLAKSRNEERLQSEADAARGELAMERR